MNKATIQKFKKFFLWQYPNIADIEIIKKKKSIKFILTRESLQEERTFESFEEFIKIAIEHNKKEVKFLKSLLPKKEKVKK